MKIEILYSAPHTFYYDPKFHPEKRGIVAAQGWRAIVRVSNNNDKSITQEAVLGLSQTATEQTAIEFAKGQIG